MADFTLECGKLNNRQDPIRLGKITDFRDPRITTIVQAQNFDIDSQMLATCRAGQNSVYSGATHSFWVHPFDDSVAYFVEDGVLKKLNADYSATTVYDFGNDFATVFEVVGDEVVVSNSDVIGWIKDTTFTPFSQTTTQFEALMPAGDILAYDPVDNVLLVGANGEVFKSKPYNVEVREERLSEFPFDGHVRMLGCVEDGWWIATDKRVGFVSRQGEDGYDYVHVSDNPPPSGCFKTGWEKTENGSRRYVAWASVDGVIEGRSGGQFRIMDENVVLPVGDSGKLFSRNNNGIDQYIAVIFNPENKETFTPSELGMTTISV